MIRSIDSSHDGKYFAIIVGDNMIYIMDANTKTTFHSGSIHILESRYEYLHCAKFSMDDTYLAFASSHGNIYVYKTSTFMLEKKIASFTPDYPGRMSHLEFSQNGKYFIHGMHDTLNTNMQIYDASTFELLHTLPTKSMLVSGVSLSADSRRLAISGKYDGAKIYDMNTFELIHTIENMNDDVLHGVSFSRDRKYLVLGYDSIVKVIDVHTFQEIALCEKSRVCESLFSSNGKYLALLSPSFSDDVSIYDAKTFQELYIHDGKHSNISWAFEFSMDGQWLIIGDFSGYVQFLNLTTFKIDFRMKMSIV